MFLSMEDRRKKLQEVGNATREDALNKLQEHGVCLVNRPTGFGKTYLLCKVASKYLKMYPDKRVVYIFPTYIIINEIMGNAEYEDVKHKLSFFSYQGISQSFSENGKGKQKDLILETVKNASIILVDEVHRAGADGFKLFFDYIKNEIGKGKIHMLGVTATIDRSDMEETRWIKEYMFRGIEAYDYSLGSAINDGVLLEPVVHRPIFDIDTLIETTRGEIKSIHQNNKFFNQNDFERKLQSLRTNFNDNGKQIYDRMKEVGYRLDSDNPDDSYLKFIVFFKDTNHLLEEGENIENYFRDAVNGVASADLGKKIKTSLSVEYVISDTADRDHEYQVKAFCEKKSFRTYRNKPVEVGTYSVEREEPVFDKNGIVKTDKDGNDIYKKKRVLEYIKPKAHHIDLIFNVSTLVMGYHVPYTSGVMLLRSTDSSITFFQQIGRCFSAKSTKRPIIFDVVSNTAKDFEDDTRNMIKSIIGRGTGGGNGGEPKDDTQEYVTKQVGIDENATETFLATINAMKNRNYFEHDRIYFLYVERNMPIAFIANDMSISCKRVANVLLGMGVELTPEDNEYKYLESDFAETKNGKTVIETNKDSFKLLNYINSKRADNLFKKHKQGKSLFELLANHRRRNR